MRRTLAFARHRRIGPGARPAPASADVRPARGSRTSSTLQGPVATPAVGYGLVVGLNKTGDREQTIFSAQTLASMLERFGVDGVAQRDEGREHRRGGRHRGDRPVHAERRPHRRGGVVDRRRAQPAGRDAAADTAARARRQRGGAGAGTAVDRRLRRRRRRATRWRSTTSPSAACRAARWCRRPRPVALAGRRHVAPGAATNPTSPRPRAWRRRSTWSSAPTPRTPSTPARSACRCRPPTSDSLAELIARLEPLSVNIDAGGPGGDQRAHGTVVMGGDVRIGAAAVAHGNLSVRISTRLDVSQPAPFAQRRDHRRAADAPRRGRGRQQAGCARRRDDADRRRAGAQRARRHAARHHRHHAGAQGGRRAAGGDW